jgi:phosphatidylglycerol lysyltransferase
MGEEADAADVALAPSDGKWRRRFRRLTPHLGLGVLAAAAWIVGREVSAHDPREIWESFVAVRPGAVVAALGVCFVSFTMLALVERSALQMLHREQPFGRVFRYAFVTYGLSNAIGFSYASAPATRARVYRHRLRVREVAALSLITAASVGLGAITAAGVSLLIDAPRVSGFASPPDSVLRVLGCALLAPALFWIAASVRRKVVTLWGMRFRSLGVRRAALQVVYTTIDWMATGAILFVFLPDDIGWSYLSFVAVFVAAGMIGAVSGTPGGLGAFEATILSLAPVAATGPQLIAALVAYRMVFTILPLCVAAALLAFDFLRKNARHAA